MTKGELKRQTNPPQQNSQTSLIADISLFFKKSSGDLSSLLSVFYKILAHMEEQDKSEIIVTEKEVEEWIKILEQIKTEIIIIRPNLKQKKD